MPSKKTSSESVSKSKTYRQLREELDTVILKLQDPEVDVDAAADMYTEALTLIKQLEAHLESAENRIKKVQADFSI